MADAQVALQSKQQQWLLLVPACVGQVQKERESWAHLHQLSLWFTPSPSSGCGPFG